MLEQIRVRFLYKIWRGETAWRVILHVQIWFGGSEWHSEAQWHRKALDQEKGAERDFALNDIFAWKIVS